ncbi:MAG: cytochrome c biogenesis protein CcdA, partial [Lentisphaeria bacterium]|nr:cytochrome c biogenesis protein CcdA [Lentisphaeria bacterium]
MTALTALGMPWVPAVLASAVMTGLLGTGIERLALRRMVGRPVFVTIISSFLFLFGLSLFGVFEIGTSLVSVGGQYNNKSGMAGSFLSGVTATVVATPCTAPFMGSALGFALTQSTMESLLIFGFLGLGMAAPYLLLSSVPSLLRFVPKPGAWMESFKQFMGFLLMATVVWLVFVIGNQTGVIGMTMLLGLLVFL